MAAYTTAKNAHKNNNAEEAFMMSYTRTHGGSNSLRRTRLVGLSLDLSLDLSHALLPSFLPDLFTSAFPDHDNEAYNRLWTS